MKIFVDDAFILIFEDNESGFWSSEVSDEKMLNDGNRVRRFVVLVIGEIQLTQMSTQKHWSEKTTENLKI